MRVWQVAARSILLLASLAAAMGVTGCCGSSGSAPSDGDDVKPRIIFRSAMDAPADGPDFEANPQKYFELYTMKADGSDVQRITDNAYYEEQPDVCPDVQKIVCSIHYSAGRVGGTDPGWEIAVMDIDGENLTRLTNNDYLDFGPHWNHDGTKIVYVSDSAQRTADDIENGALPKYDIYTMDPNGDNVEQLTSASPGDVDADPSFSFTSPSKILYIHSEGLSGSFDLYVMDTDGENQQLILEHDADLLKINDPMFSPDGSKIVFEAKVRESDGNPIYNLFTVDASGGDLTRITEDDGESDVLPQYSPDGTKIAYYTYVWEEGGGNTHRIRVANADGSEEEVISTYPWEADPSWIPVGDG